jgi:hypothetical protein
LFQSNDNTEINESNEIGRYKEVKIKSYNYRGEETGERVRILDTETGEYVNPSE